MELLDGDLAVIRSTARWFGRKANVETDELINIAVIEILGDKIEYELTGDRQDYIRKIATNSIKEFLKEGRPMIKIPTRSSIRHDLKDVHRVPVDPKTFAISESMGPAETVMIEDSLLHASKTPLEKSYMKLRLLGYTNQEAVVELDISDCKASQMLWKIEQRFRKDWDE